MFSLPRLASPEHPFQAVFLVTASFTNNENVINFVKTNICFKGKGILY